MHAKIISGGSPVTYTSTGSTNGNASEPDEVLHKVNASDASNGEYSFEVNFQAYFTNNGIGEGTSSFGQLEFFVRSGGVWVSLGTEGWGDGGTHISEGTHTRNFTYTKNFGGAIGQTSDQEFGVSRSEDITSINFINVTYTNTAASTTRTATPSGRKVSVRIIPKNG